MDPLFGEIPIVEVVIQGVDIFNVMIDTGKNMSCIDVGWFRKTYRGITVRKLDVIIKGVNGTNIPYKGYVELDLLIPGMDLLIRILHC